jgi:hypothetical protein
MRRSTIALITLLALGGSASAAGVALGPVLKRNHVGARAAVDAGILVIAVEHYSLDDGERTRGEVAAQLSLPLGPLTIAPSLGVFPIDYEQHDNGASGLAFTLSATVSLSFKIWGPVWAVLEPLRFENILLQHRMGSPPKGGTDIDHAEGWQAGSWVAVRLGF